VNRLGAALLLSLLGVRSGPAAAQKPLKKEPAAAAAPAEKVQAMMADRAAVFGEVDAAYKTGDKARVADGLLDVTRNPDHIAYHAEAYARLSGVLQELSLPYTALVAAEKALAIDAAGVSSVAAQAIALADQVGDTALLEPVFAANVGLDVAPEVRSRMGYLAAREAHAQGNYGTSLALLKMVRNEDPFSPEARFLEGVVMAQQGRHAQALAPLLTAEGAAKQLNKSRRFQDAVALNIARAYYGAENFPRAIEYFAKVQRDSSWWPEAQFERAWAHFRIQDINGALGVLHDHQGPFLEEFYFPEAALLQIYSLFLMCKFPEASKQLASFQAEYGAVHQELRRVAAMEPDDLFAQMRAHLETGRSDLPRMVTRIYEQEDRFRDSLRAVVSAEDEARRLQNVASHPFSQPAAAWVSDRRDALVRAEGKRIGARVRGMEQQLGGILTDSEMSKLDLLQMETRLFEQAANRGKLADARAVVDRGVKVKKGYQRWDWEGEYWADEAGWYRYNAMPECPADLMGGGN
jgi:tetratricopeptide (TPR) repeat protein